MKVGDMIECSDKDDMLAYHEGLSKYGVSTEFVYEKDGVKGFWLEVTKLE